MSAFGLGGGPGGFEGMGMGMGMGAPRGFEEQYHCYPVSFQVNQQEERPRSYHMEVDDVFGTSRRGLQDATHRASRVRCWGTSV